MKGFKPKQHNVAEDAKSSDPIDTHREPVGIFCKFRYVSTTAFFAA